MAAKMQKPARKRQFFRQRVDSASAVSRFSLEAVVIGTGGHYLDERAALANLLDIAFSPRLMTRGGDLKRLPWRPDEVAAALQALQAITQCQGVQAESGVDLYADARLGILPDSAPQREIRRSIKEARTMFLDLFGPSAEAWRSGVTEVPAFMAGMTAMRSDDGRITITWRLTNWSAAFRATLALLFHKYAADVGICAAPDCGRPWIRMAPARGRRPTHCGPTCGSRARQQRKRRASLTSET